MQSSSSDNDKTKNPGRVESPHFPHISSGSPTTDQGSMCKTTSRRRIRRRNRGGSETQFPGKLYDMLEYAEENDLDSVVSWIKGGHAFMVHNPEKLVDVLPIFFGQTKYRSFRRQLNMWHFHRILEGPDRGAFMHPCFIKGNKQLCSHMSRHVFAPPPAPFDLGDRSRYEEWRIESLKLDQPLVLANDEMTNEFPILVASDPSTDGNFENHECEMFEPNSIVLTESPILSSSLEKLPGISIAGLSDGDALCFAGRQFHFLEECQNKTNRSRKKISSTPLIKGCQEMASKNPTSYQLDAFWYGAPMIVSAALLEPIDPEIIDSLFSESLWIYSLPKIFPTLTEKLVHYCAEETSSLAQLLSLGRRSQQSLDVRCQRANWKYRIAMAQKKDHVGQGDPIKKVETITITPWLDVDSYRIDLILELRLHHIIGDRKADPTTIKGRRFLSIIVM